MLSTVILIIVIVCMIAVWIIVTQRRLVILDENINAAMCQIGVQLSARFDTLMVLMELAQKYEQDEIETLMESTNLKRTMITEKSTPEDLFAQESIISEALCIILFTARKHPQLKQSEEYIKTMDAMITFENMIRTSRLVYNQGVSKLNRDIRMIPICLFAPILGFSKKDLRGKIR